MDVRSSRRSRFAFRVRVLTGSGLHPTASGSANVEIAGAAFGGVTGVRFATKNVCFPACR